jgi:hypothetical protein
MHIKYLSHFGAIQFGVLRGVSLADTAVSSVALIGRNSAMVSLRSNQ